ncbi:MAG: nucleoside recognition protein [Defluviitaleaceae bacterium]|nr:nucleoside recognition protein [Defluviitaleaceae bacterium]
MLNYIWAGMILLGILCAFITGRMPEVTNAAIESSKEAVAVCITMLGILSMWMGLMRIAEDAGAVTALSRKMRPVLSFLFPRLPKGSKALEYISANMLANMLGLAWAATPAGLKAMDELQKLNIKKDTASDEMCMFMIINMSSLQLVTVNIIAWRAQYNSANPSEIIGPGLAATAFSTIVAVIFAKAAGFFSPRDCDLRASRRKEATRC